MTAAWRKWIRDSCGYPGSVEVNAGLITLKLTAGVGFGVTEAAHEYTPAQLQGVVKILNEAIEEAEKG